MTDVATGLETSIRWSVRKDIPEMLKIERDAFADPWSEDHFLSTMKAKNAVGLTAHQGDRIVGYVFYDLAPTCLRLLNVAVALPDRMTGVGRALVGKVVGKMQGHRRDRVMTRVREDNLNGQKFLRELGFRATEIVPNAFPDGEAAYQMEFTQGDEPC